MLRYRTTLTHVARRAPAAGFLLILLCGSAIPIESQQRDTDTKRDYLCSDTRGARPLNRSPQFSFARSIVLNVTIDGVSNRASRKSSLITALQEAAAAWRYACSSCSRANALAINVDDRLFLLSALIDVTRETPENETLALGELLAPPLTTLPKVGDPVPKHLLGAGRRITERIDSRMRAPSGVGLYREATDDVVARICGSAESDEVIDALKHAMGCPTKGFVPADASLKITKASRPSLCNGGGEVIACEAAGHIELITTNTFIIRQDDKPRTVVGGGGPEIDLVAVLMHELGHWLGVRRHLDDESRSAGIMRSTISDDACIDRPAIEHLGSSTDLLLPMALRRRK